MWPINIFTCITLIFVVIYSIGLLTFLSDFEEDKCEMTYMFEYPQFVKISNKKDEKFSKYGLYAYSEGRFTTKVRSMQFDGIPVLFIPGNAGSYKQVRSLSSVALRKALSLGSSYHFDYFTVNLNSELSGVYGPLLYDQLEYVNSSFNRIFELYNEGNKPNSIIMIGHSMGGVIAKKLISEMETNSVSLLIALAAPLKRPPLIFDYYTNRFYENDKSIMEKKNTLIISISGGYSDFLVPSYFSDITQNNSLHAVATNIPRSWVEANHVQIVWCKQIVLAINRALFDSIDPETKQISQNVTYLQKVFKHHLVQHSGIKVRKYESYSKVTKIDNRGKWIESLLTQYSIEFLHGVRETHWYMVKLNTLPSHQMLTILAINLEIDDWVFVCSAFVPKGRSRVCNEAIHLTHFSEIAPSVKYKRRYLQINMHELRKNYTELTHVVIRNLPTNEPLVFHVDIYNSADRIITVDLPSWWALKKTVILEETFKNAVHYELVLPQLQHMLQYYQLFVEPLTCSIPIHHASATVSVPWGNQDYHAYFTNSESNPLNVRLFTSKPLSHSNNSVIIRLILEPSCTYQISIKSSIFGSLGQMARIYSPLLLTNIAVIVLLILKYQIRSLKDGYCSSFFIALKNGAKPFYVVPFMKLLPMILSKAEIYVSVPKTDLIYLAEDGTEFVALTILLFLCSVGIVFLLGIIYSISLVTLDSTIHKLSLKLTGTALFSLNSSDFITTLLEKAPFIAAGILIFTSISTCGSLALCLGALFYFLKLTHLSQEYVEKLVWFFIRQFDKKWKNFFRIFFKSANKQHVLKNTKNDDEKHVKTLKGEKINNEKQGISDVSTLEEKTIESNNLHNQKLNSQIKETDKGVDELNEREDGVKVKENDGINANKGGLKEEGNNELTVANNSLFFHTTVFFLWCIITLINLPAGLTWAHNFEFSKTLTPDSSFIPAIILSLCTLPLWQFDLPRVGKKWSIHLEIFVTMIAVLSLLYAAISVYRLNYLLILVIVVLILHQLFAPQASTGTANTTIDSDDKNISNYENVKLKLN